MARFTLQMTCDNAAFEDNISAEIARILRHVADQAANNHAGYYADFYQTILDANGSDVGRWRLAINRQD